MHQDHAYSFARTFALTTSMRRQAKLEYQMQTVVKNAEHAVQRLRATLERHQADYSDALVFDLVKDTGLVTRFCQCPDDVHACEVWSLESIHPVRWRLIMPTEMPDSADVCLGHRDGLYHYARLEGDGQSVYHTRYDPANGIWLEPRAGSLSALEGDCDETWRWVCQRVYILLVG